MKNDSYRLITAHLVGPTKNVAMRFVVVKLFLSLTKFTENINNI